MATVKGKKADVSSVSPIALTKGHFTFSTQLLTLNYLLYSPTDAAPQFLQKLTSFIRFQIVRFVVVFFWCCSCHWFSLLQFFVFLLIIEKNKKISFRGRYSGSILYFWSSVQCSELFNVASADVRPKELLIYYINCCFQNLISHYIYMETAV